MNKEIKEILSYFEKYVKTIDMHDSEPMVNWKDLKIVLDYINDNECKYKKLLENYYNTMFRINTVIELIAPLVAWGECTINGKILKQISDILKGE